MTAVETGNVEVVRLLLARGADVNAATVATNNTALMWAVAGRHTDIVHRLIEHGADLDVSTAKGFTLLMIAARNGDIEMARTLLAAGVDINAAGADGAHVLPYAIVIGQAEFARFLLEAGADPNARITSSAVFEEYLGYPRRGAFDTYTSGAGCQGGEESVPVMRLLLAAGADPTLTTDDGTTPLMVAAGLGRYTNDKNLRRGTRSPSSEEAVTLLLDAGAAVNARNEADFTALHGAAFRGLNEVIRILLDRGADIDARDFRGRTPYRLAEGSKQSFYFQEYPETAALLEELGADTSLGLAATVQERLRDVSVGDAEAGAGQQQQQN